MTDLSSGEGFAASSLPTLKNKEALALYRNRINVGKKWREAEGYDETWKRCRDIYRLQMLANKDTDQVPVAIGFATINVIEPSVAINTPKFTVLARREDVADQATIAEAALNYWWKHYNFHTQFRSAVKDSLIYGIGWVKVGWRFEEELTLLSPDEYDDQLESAIRQARLDAEQFPERAHLLPTDEDIDASLDPTKMEVTLDRPFVERVSPLDIYIDPEATCPENLQWIAQKVIRPLAEVKVDERFDKKARKKLVADSSVRWQNEDSGTYSGDDVQRVTLWEFYDITRQMMCVFTEAGDDFLVAPQEFPYTYGAPFVPLFDYDVPDQFYSIGELEAIEGLQDELNEVRTAMVQARKLDIQKYMARESSLGPKALTALRSDIPNDVIGIADDSPLEDVLAPLPRNGINPQLYQHSGQIEADVNYVSGVNEYMRGQVSETRRTATEAAMIQDNANARSSDKLAKVEAFLAEIGRRLLTLAQEYLTTEQVVRVINPLGETIWAEFSREDIQGEFDFEVEAGSTQPRNETFRKQQANQMLQALGPFIGTVLDPTQFVAHILRDGFGIPNPERFFLQQGPPPMDPGMGGPEGPPPSPGMMPDEVSPEQATLNATANQLAGQVGLDTATLGGGALGPGGGF